MKKNEISVDDTQAHVHTTTMKAHKKNPHAVALGRIGGRATGQCKARTPEQARAAAFARWSRYHDAQHKTS